MSSWSFKKKKKGLPEDTNLNITAMADIMTILLVFLLKGYSTSVINIQPTAGLVLPQAEAEQQDVNALKIQVSPTAVTLEEQSVLELKDYRFEKGELSRNGTAKNLVAALEQERKKQLYIAKANEEVKVDPRIIVVSDQNTPYSTLKAVLASAAVTGYTDFKLAVVTE